MICPVIEVFFRRLGVNASEGLFTDWLKKPKEDMPAAPPVHDLNNHFHEPHPSRAERMIRTMFL